jgi:unsaturated rhamnogalacturonyl hydrolase
VLLLVLAVVPGIARAVAVEAFALGRAADGTSIDGLAVPASRDGAPTIVLVGGLAGEGEEVATLRGTAAAYARRRDRPVQLLVVPRANPAREALAFPPSGVAYREQAAAQALWRWLGSQAPDRVLVAGPDGPGLAAALASYAVVDMGTVPATAGAGTLADLLATARAARPAPSAARAELDRRRARSPRELATQLARHYGRDFDQPWYIGAVALGARLRLGDVADVRRLVEPYVDGTKDSLARPNALVMAGHVVFTDLARHTADPRYVAAVRKVADLGFGADGRMLEAMPYHEGYSDSVFMGTVIAAQAGALTGERRYFDLADRHLRFMQQLDLRADGLYRHHPQTDTAWGRGNGFAALGLALTLSEMPADHPGHAHALASYRSLMAALLPLQTRDGLWRNVLDHPAAYPEFSATAMIGFALRRGLTRGWISGPGYQRAVERAWVAVNSRSSEAGGFIDVCESTMRVTTETGYLERAAILGPDARGGAMALLFATELTGD